MANPFLVPGAEAAPASNPFLSPAPAPVAPAPVAPAPAPVAQQFVAQVAMPASGPHSGRTPSMAPSLRDAHADFRKGQWKKPALMGLVACALIAGFAVLSKTPEPERPLARAERPEAEGPVIGASVSPLVIADPDANRFERAKKQSSSQALVDEESEPSGAPTTGSSANLADAFKQAAR